MSRRAGAPWPRRDGQYDGQAADFGQQRPAGMRRAALQAPTRFRASLRRRPWMALAAAPNTGWQDRQGPHAAPACPSYPPPRKRGCPCAGRRAAWMRQCPPLWQPKHSKFPRGGNRPALLLRGNPCAEAPAARERLRAPRCAGRPVPIPPRLPASAERLATASGMPRGDAR